MTLLIQHQALPLQRETQIIIVFMAACSSSESRLSRWSISPRSTAVSQAIDPSDAVELFKMGASFIRH